MPSNPTLIKHLNAFKTAKVWSDLITHLSNIYYELKKMDKEQLTTAQKELIPILLPIEYKDNKIFSPLFMRRLWQCLNLYLPAGVHAKVMNNYALLLDINTFYIRYVYGLYSYGSFAKLSVREDYLKLIHKIYLKGVDLNDNVRHDISYFVIYAIQPLFDDTIEIFSTSVDYNINQIVKHILKDDLLDRCFANSILNEERGRVGAFKIMRDLIKTGDLKVSTKLILNAVKASLRTNEIFLVKNALDFLKVCYDNGNILTDEENIDLAIFYIPLFLNKDISIIKRILGIVKKDFLIIAFLNYYEYYKEKIVYKLISTITALDIKLEADEKYASEYITNKYVRVINGKVTLESLILPLFITYRNIEKLIQLFSAEIFEREITAYMKIYGTNSKINTYILKTNQQFKEKAFYILLKFYKKTMIPFFNELIRNLNIQSKFIFKLNCPLDDKIKMLNACTSIRLNDDIIKNIILDGNFKLNILKMNNTKLIFNLTTYAENYFLINYLFRYIMKKNLVDEYYEFLREQKLVIKLYIIYFIIEMSRYNPTMFKNMLIELCEYALSEDELSTYEEIKKLISELRSEVIFTDIRSGGYFYFLIKYSYVSDNNLPKTLEFKEGVRWEPIKSYVYQYLLIRDAPIQNIYSSVNIYQKLYIQQFSHSRETNKTFLTAFFNSDLKSYVNIIDFLRIAIDFVNEFYTPILTNIIKICASFFKGNVGRGGIEEFYKKNSSPKFTFEQNYNHEIVNLNSHTKETIYNLLIMYRPILTKPIVNSEYINNPYLYFPSQKYYSTIILTEEEKYFPPCFLMRNISILNSQPIIKNSLKWLPRLLHKIYKIHTDGNDCYCCKGIPILSKECSDFINKIIESGMFDEIVEIEFDGVLLSRIILFYFNLISDRNYSKLLLVYQAKNLKDNDTTVLKKFLPEIRRYVKFETNYYTENCNFESENSSAEYINIENNDGSSNSINEENEKYDFQENDSILETITQTSESEEPDVSQKFMDMVRSQSMVFNRDLKLFTDKITVPLYYDLLNLMYESGYSNFTLPLHLFVSNQYRNLELDFSPLSSFYFSSVNEQTVKSACIKKITASILMSKDNFYITELPKLIKLISENNFDINRLILTRAVILKFSPDKIRNVWPILYEIVMNFVGDLCEKLPHMKNYWETGCFKLDYEDYEEDLSDNKPKNINMSYFCEILKTLDIAILFGDEKELRMVLVGFDNFISIFKLLRIALHVKRRTVFPFKKDILYRMKLNTYKELKNYISICESYYEKIIQDNLNDVKKTDVEMAVLMNIE